MISCWQRSSRRTSSRRTRRSCRAAAPRRPNAGKPRSAARGCARRASAAAGTQSAAPRAPPSHKRTRGLHVSIMYHSGAQTSRALARRAARRFGSAAACRGAAVSPGTASRRGLETRARLVHDTSTRRPSGGLSAPCARQSPSITTYVGRVVDASRTTHGLMRGRAASLLALGYSPFCGTEWQGREPILTSRSRMRTSHLT